MVSALVQTDLGGVLPLVARGKVRDLYNVSDDSLLFVATDRISAYDVIMTNGIPSKGKILTGVSQFWFDLLKNETKNHLISTGLPDVITKEHPELLPQLQHRSMLVHKYKVLPLEVIVRGYLTGSAWAEYKKSGTVHGIPIRAGMQESEAFDKPIYTPSTKAEQGEHDENISPEQAEKILGSKELAQRIEELALRLYNTAAEYAKSKGIIIADTKFEFGLDEQTDSIVLIDEVLTPDSSRFWRKDSVELGKTPDSYDKQFLRNWLVDNKLKGKEGVSIPLDIVEQTRAKYIEAYEVLTGQKWVE